MNGSALWRSAPVLAIVALPALLVFYTERADR